jgi:holo-[acyl-carrier protein] synthase
VTPPVEVEGAVRGIGVDAVDVARFRALLERRPGLAARLFTAGERGYAEGTRDPGPRYAVRFAAKEATLKAFGAGLGAADFHDMEVLRDGEGAPTLRLVGRAAALADRLGVGHCHVSLTHTDLVAVATVVAASGGPRPGGQAR